MLTPTDTSKNKGFTGRMDYSTDPNGVRIDVDPATGADKTSSVPTPAPATQTPAPTPNETSAPTTTTTSDYTTAKGDTLSAIAKKNGTNIQALMAANPSIKNPNQIGIGQKLTLPGAPKGTTGTGTSNDHQNKVLGAINGVTDQSKTNDIRAAAASVPYQGSELPPAVSQSVDTLVASLVPMIQETLNPSTHSESLLTDYKTFSKELGIDDLNTQYMNLNNVISGTEDDIRAEITKAGGTATESQVEAMAASRNKNLILKANGLQALITNKTDSLNTMVGLQEKDRTYASDKVDRAINLTSTLATMQNTIDKNTNDNYDKIITNVGYQGLAATVEGNPYAQGLAEKSLGLPAGTLSDPAAVARLQTYKDKTAQLGAQRIAQGEQRIIIQQQAQPSLLDSRDALTASRYSSIVNSTIKSYYSTNKSPIQAYNNSSQVINRVDEAYKLASDPKNKNKAAPDLDLIDSYVSIARGGQNITEAQVDTLLGGLGIKAKFDVNTQKITGSATLDNGTRKSLVDLSKNIFEGQKKLANESVDKINKDLTRRKVPSDFLLSGPDEIGDPSQLGGGALVNGKHYDTGQTLKVGNITLTAQDDGTLSGSDGKMYDSEGNEI